MVLVRGKAAGGRRQPAPFSLSAFDAIWLWANTWQALSAVYSGRVGVMSCLTVWLNDSHVNSITRWDCTVGWGVHSALFNGPERGGVLIAIIRVLQQQVRLCYR
jgi:hypothetical protein